MSSLTTLLVREIHEKHAHSGIYSILSEFRKSFFVPHCFTVIKKVLKNCIHCRKLHAKPVKLSQNVYRDFRVNPSQIPFRTAFLDYLGPFKIRENNETSKVYILCITCLFSRSVNLKICRDLTLDNFLRAFQLHSMEYGLPQTLLSDSGSQLVSAGKILNDFLNDETTKSYLNGHGISSFNFTHYPKGNSELGGLVESCVKIVKRLIYGSIKNNVLDYSGFEFIVCQTVHLANRRPIAFKEALRQSDFGQLPSAITPEILLKGHELVSVNVIPNLSFSDPDSVGDPDWPPVGCSKSVAEGIEKLKKCRQYLNKLYHEEFMSNLMCQSTNLNNRYKKISHEALQINDVVLLKEPLCKPTNYPMAVVTNVVRNDLDEVTTVTVHKGNTGELVTRHVTSVIPLFSPNLPCNTSSTSTDNGGSSTSAVREARRPRKAAVLSRKKTADLVLQHAI